MKTLLVMRHAKSSWDRPDLSDHDRPLNARGKRAAPAMGRFLRAQGIEPGRIVCSTAKRAHDTAERVREAGEFPPNAQTCSRLYLAGTDDHIDVLAATKEAVDCVLLVGHNPGAEELVEYLTRTEVTLPTAAVAWVEIPIDAWSDIGGAGLGSLRAVWLPRDLDTP